MSAEDNEEFAQIVARIEVTATDRWREFLDRLQIALDAASASWLADNPGFEIEPGTSVTIQIPPAPPSGEHP